MTWIKITTNKFDVPIGAGDSVQIADLVGIYILDTLSRIINPKQIGLYRDDGLIFIPECNGQKTCGFKQRLEYREILKDNFEICNNENNDNNNVNNNNNSNCNWRIVNGETNNMLNNIK